jgi:hypothetical protein
MTEWTPQVAVMTKERDSILQLVRLCKRYQARSRAATTALGLLPPKYLPLLELILALKQELLVSSEQEAEIEYREVEYALLGGTDYLPALQELLDRHRPAH